MIFCVEDDNNIRDLLVYTLETTGFHAKGLADPLELWQALAQEEPELILLDIMMPNLDGIRATRKIRETSSVPIIMLSAKSEDVDKILGLNIGADDYITKPFNPLELTVRVKTQLRRYTRYNTVGFAGEQDEEIDIRGMHISKASHKCTLNGQEVAFTPLEFDIVWYLAKRQGNVVSSEELFEAVWKEKYLDNNNTVMAHIARIRDKMHEMPRKPKFIKTVWGVGYTIE